MWLIRAFLQLLLRVVVGVMLSAGVAALVALARGGAFLASLRLTLLAVGCVALLAAGAGQSASDRTISTGGRLPNMPAWTRTPPGDTSLSAGAVFALTGIALLAIAALLPT